MTEETRGWRRFERSSDAYLTITGLLFLLILTPIATSGVPELERVVTAILVGVVVTLSMTASRAHRWMIHVAWVASLLAVAGALLSTPERLRTVAAFILAVLLIASPVVILRRIGAHQKVTATTIWGAIAAYLAFGMAFSLLYATIHAVNPEAFNNMAHGGLGDTNYFSFVTQTTLGYGDISPADDVPRALVVFQTLIGQIYLVVVVARVVSLLGQNNQRLTRSPGD